MTTKQAVKIAEKEPFLQNGSVPHKEAANGYIHNNNADKTMEMSSPYDNYTDSADFHTTQSCLTSQRDVAELEEQPEQTKEAVSKKRRALTILTVILRFIGLIALLYFFICSLDLLSSAFTLMGGRSAGEAFKNDLISNPICGVMIGLVATAFLQSSSTSTSIVITMVAANLLDVRTAIPIIMGSNIGTSVTGILVSVAQAGDREQFRKAFSAATVHDMFNWLTVIVLLPLEVVSGYLYHVTTALVNSANLTGGGSKQEFLKVITRPFTDLIVQVDKSVLEDIAAGKPDADKKPLLKYWCEFYTVPANSTLPPGVTMEEVPPYDVVDGTSATGALVLHGVNAVTSPEYPESTITPTIIIGITPCQYLFHGTSLSEVAVGGITLVIALVMLITCLILMVKILKSLLQGSMASIIQKTINADFPGHAACLTGYVAILVGAVVTVLVQSSSVVASALTPLVGLGLVTVERVFPMMLGANIGTTSTAILASFAASGESIRASFQIAMCHLFFNLSGILIWYPLPFMRRVPIKLAKFLGRTTCQYRWFAVVYLLGMFFVFPLLIFALSIPGWYVLAAVGIPIILLIIFIGIVNCIQNRKPKWLPKKLQTWDFLPLWMRSLAPLDHQVARIISCCSCCKCCQKMQAQGELDVNPEELNISKDPGSDVASIEKYFADAQDKYCQNTTADSASEQDHKVSPSVQNGSIPTSNVCVHGSLPSLKYESNV